MAGSCLGARESILISKWIRLLDFSFQKGEKCLLCDPPQLVRGILLWQPIQYNSPLPELEAVLLR